ncbi:translation initiation factor IF-2-like [Penaeus monodon]|uniref:translation initiation factor IF-2-like n=1 Tax=Penaeus monodon TaxID=6687 RepID=UPI0018A750D1|nr:translation initiation factor IF-2-like [Penaeus monodon]
MLVPFVTFPRPSSPYGGKSYFSPGPGSFRPMETPGVRQVPGSRKTAPQNPTPPPPTPFWGRSTSSQVPPCTSCPFSGLTELAPNTVDTALLASGVKARKRVSDRPHTPARRCTVLPTPIRPKAPWALHKSPRPKQVSGLRTCTGGDFTPQTSLERLGSPSQSTSHLPFPGPGGHGGVARAPGQGLPGDSNPKALASATAGPSWAVSPQVTSPFLKGADIPRAWGGARNGGLKPRHFVKGAVGMGQIPAFHRGAP